METVKALRVTTEGIESFSFAPTLEQVQEQVGGYFTVVTFYDERFCIVCNEEGGLMGLPQTCIIRKGKLVGVPLVGNVLLLGITDDGAEFVDLPEEIKEHWSDYITLTAVSKGDT